MRCLTPVYHDNIGGEEVNVDKQAIELDLAWQPCHKHLDVANMQVWSNSRNDCITATRWPALAVSPDAGSALQRCEVRPTL